MKHTEGSFIGYGKMQLRFQCWFPDKPPLACILISHGFGEHMGRYGNVVNAFVPRDFAVYGFDLRGHGKSPGQRGHIDSFADYRGDLKAFYEKIHASNPTCPVFIYGHSLGALIVLDYILHYSEGLQGAIISGAPIQPAGVAKPYLVALGRVMTHLYPRIPIKLNLDISALAHDPEITKAYDNDPLVHGMVSARWGTECLDTLARVKEHATEIKVPILIVHGEADRLNTVEGARNLYNWITIPDKSLLIDPGGYHEPQNDVNHIKVLQAIGDWIQGHI